MENENGQTSRDTDHVCHCDGSSSQGRAREVPPGINHSISPGVPCPETVLVAVMSNCSYLLVGYPQAGPAALVVHDDAGPLRQALTAAFGGSTDEAASGNGNSTEIAVPGNKALHTTQAQP